MKTPVEVLTEALEKFGPNGEHWGKGNVYERPEGTFCASQAIIESENPGARDFERSPAWIILRLQLGENVPIWNDRPTTSFEHIQNAFHSAIDTAKRIGRLK